jgi:hypothetical protein
MILKIASCAKIWGHRLSEGRVRLPPSSGVSKRAGFKAQTLLYAGILMAIVSTDSVGLDPASLPISALFITLHMTIHIYQKKFVIVY